MTETEQIHTNGIDTIEEEDLNKNRPADIEAVCVHIFIFLNI